MVTVRNLSYDLSESEKVSKQNEALSPIRYSLLLSLVYQALALELFD